MAKIQVEQEHLLDQFIASFEKLDEMIADQILSPVAWELAVGEPDANGYKRWRPKKIPTARSHLETLYAKLPARLPLLFENLVLGYRWAEVELGSYTLLANPPGEGLSGLMQEMSRAPDLWSTLLPAGYIPFGKGPDMDYDPVCFDIKSRKKNGECRIVKIDHEEILCNFRVKVTAQLAPSFEELIRQTVKMAGQIRKSP